MLGAGVWTVEASDGSVRIGDPFASRPMGPFALLTNPATVALEDGLGIHLGFQSSEEQGPLRLVGYSEPGTGLAAGALVWVDGGEDDTKWRQIAYSLGRFITERIAFGVNVKHVATSEEGRWAADLGLYLPAEQGLQLGVVYHNAFGAVEDDPGELVASASLLSEWGWALSVEVRGPWSSPDPALSWAVDVPLGSGGVLRAGHVEVLGGDGQTEWLGGLHWDFKQFSFDISVALPTDGEARYRVGLQIAF